MSWSKKYGDRCIDCGTQERPHYIGGRCLRCHGKWNYHNNPEPQRQWRRAYYWKDPELARQRTKDYNKANYELFKQRNKQRRETLHFAGLREAVLLRDNHTCQVCGKHAELVHHKDMTGRASKQRKNTMNDLIALCRACHIRLHKPNRWTGKQP